MQVNIYEAKNSFSKLIECALSGEEVIIAKAGRPLLRLAPIEARVGNGVRLGGLKDAGIEVDEAFYAQGSDADLLGADT